MHCEFPIRLKTLCKYSLQPLLNPRPSHFLKFYHICLKRVVLLLDSSTACVNLQYEATCRKTATNVACSL